MNSPESRPRRWRASTDRRRLVRQTRLSVDDLIQPVFVAERESDAGPIAAMPGIRRFTLQRIGEEAQRLRERRVPGVLLFGIPAHKDADGAAAYAADGVVCRAIERIRSAAPDLIIFADVCLCQYTAHGHCGVLREDTIDNDATLPLLARAGCAYATAGADFVAPSAMMDGQVAAMRAALNEAGHHDTGILSYAVKYASAFYGPFREAADCTPQFGDRRSHQMDPANAREAVREAQLDAAEGADGLLVKPALPYLDILQQLGGQTTLPLAAYQVSGEYAMIRAGADAGALDARAAALEALTAIKRARADIIVTYFAADAARWLQEG